MRRISCKSCGAPLDWDGTYSQSVTCSYCGSTFLPAATGMEDVWLMTDPVARARYEFDGSLDKLEHDIRFEVMRGGPWQPEELEYKRELRRLLCQGLLVDKGTYWFASPFPTVCRAARGGSLTVGGQRYRFQAGDDVVFQCRMTRDTNSELTGPLLIARLQPTDEARLCGQMGGAMKDRGGKM